MILNTNLLSTDIARSLPVITSTQKLIVRTLPGIVTI